MKKIILALIVALLLCAVPVFARSSYYIPGDTIFSIRAGVTFPTFISFYNKQVFLPFESTKLHLGGDASLAYQGFVTEHLMLGGQIEYAFNYSIEDMIFTTVPLTAKLTYIPVQTGTFDLALSINLGGAFIRYDKGKYFAPYAAATINPSYYFSDNWGLGIETGLMLAAEIYTSNNVKYDQSGLVALMPVTLVLSYRH
ncbi:MAG: hypothetical protein IKS77_02145 [Spirochaetales bacterium]|nr:hypothetical protein [Spirochaetales bacterium]